MRQVILDTETTGLDPKDHRIIEVGCLELVNRRLTGKKFHRYLNPERDVDEGALAVHGISRAQLAQEPCFRDIADELLSFISDAELIIHNAAFDVAFLDAELARLDLGAHEVRRVTTICTVLDTLALARELHPGQRNSLDALCKRYEVDNSRRELHGALLDAQILADVYLAMTGGQNSLLLESDTARQGDSQSMRGTATANRAVSLPVVLPTEAESVAHEKLLAVISKASGGRCLWRN
jgi:DNA polymerase III subunit epsilon